jgi:hypothetical protein
MARLTILALGFIKDERVGMELWSDIPIHGAGCIVLEFGGNEFARGLGATVSADTGVRIVFELFQGCADAIAVRLTHLIIASDKSCQRNRLWAEKVASHPARCSTVLTVFPSASWCL